MLPSAYDNGNQIIQAPGYVIIRQEMIHETRVIPLDGRPHIGKDIRLWMGDSRGHWEGDTLVVETTNYSSRIDTFKFPADSATLRIIERFQQSRNRLQSKLRAFDFVSEGVEIPDRIRIVHRETGPQKNSRAFAI